MTEPDITWIARIGQGGPYQAQVVIRANPKWASIVTERTEPYKNLPNKFRPALEGIADYVRQHAIPKTFSQEGPGWRQLSKRTQRERKAAGFNAQHPILIRTGDLYRELTDKTHPKHVEIITVGAQARVVLGGRSEKFVRNQLGNDMLRIPSRPMIPGTGWLKLDPTDEQAIKKIITQKIEEAMNHK